MALSPWPVWSDRRTERLIGEFLWRLETRRPSDWLASSSRVGSSPGRSRPRVVAPTRAPRGQRRREVLAFLAEHPGERFTEAEIAGELKISLTSVYQVTSRLLQEGKIRQVGNTQRFRPIVTVVE